MATRELISPAEYARRKGLTRAAVSKAIKRCSIPLVEGKLDPLVADTLWRHRTDPLQQQRALGQQRRHEVTNQVIVSGVLGDDWRARREKAEAQLAELELQEREGTLVKRDEVERMARRLASALVLLLSSIPDRIAAEFGVDDDYRRKMRQRLRDELDQVRGELARAGLMGEQ